MGFLPETLTARISQPAELPQRREPLWQALLIIGAGLVLGTAAAVLSPIYALAIVPAILAAYLIARRPEWGILLLMAITGGLVNYDQLPYFSLGPISFHITDVLLIYLLVLAAVRILIWRSYPYVSTRLDVPLLLFYSMAVMSLITAIVQFQLPPNTAIREFRVVTYWLGFFAVTQLIRSQQQLNTLFKGLVVLAVIMTLMVTVQMIVPSLPLVRVSSETLVTAGREFSGVSRVWISGERLIYAMLIVAVCLALLTSSNRQRRLYGLVAAILFVWLFLSYQRNYWFTTALALFMLVLLIRWRERWSAFRWVLLTAIALVLVLAIPDNPLTPWGEAALDRVFSVQASTLEHDTSALLRQTELEYAVQKVAEYPLFGVGIGNDYRPWIRRFDFFPGAVTSRGLVWYCHNAYMWIWVKMGTPALLFFLWLCFRFVYRGLRLWRRIPDTRWRAVALGFTLAFVGQMISNLVAPNFIQSWVLIIFPIMMAMNELLYKWYGLDPTPARHAQATGS
jgi:O-antigen ligase